MNGVCSAKRGYVYKFLDDSGNLLYIGSTGDIEKRMYQHFAQRAGRRKHSDKMRNGIGQTREVSYCELPSRNDAIIAEVALIQKYKPPLNTSSVEDGAVSLSLFDEHSFDWITRAPEDFVQKENGSPKCDSERKNDSQVFNALHELFPETDLRRDCVTKKQKYVLYCAMMNDADYWLPKMTNFEIGLAMDQFCAELTRKMIFKKFFMSKSS